MKIETLLSLSQVVAKYRPSEISFLERGGSDRASQLYDFLLDSSDISDEAAMSHIYGEERKPAFRKLKDRFTDKLLNMILFIDLRGPKFSDALRAITECHRQKAIFYILARFSQIRLAIEIGEKLVKRAMELDQIEVAYPVMQTLRIHFTEVEFDFKKSQYYKEQISNAFEIVQDKHFTEELNCDIFYLYAKSRSSHKDKINAVVSTKWEQLLEIQSRSTSFMVQRRCFQIKTLYAQIIGDLDRSFQYTDEALNYFQHVSPVKSNVIIGNFLIQKIVLNIRTKNYDSGLITINHALKLNPEYSRDWNVVKYLHLLLCFQCKEYGISLEVFNEVQEPKNKKKLPPFFKETFAIIEAYVHIAQIFMGNADNKMSAARYINNMPHFSKDKKGNNVPILIAHFILLLIQGKEEAAIDRIDALKQYAHRHLRNPESKRPYIFTKMISAVINGHFHHTGAQRHAKKYLKELAKYPSIDSEQAIETEIIPYEDLWEMIIELLRRR